jgi:RNA polymerase sigma factor (sigma-70 family)
LSIAFDSPPSRPSRSQIEPVALDLIRRRGRDVLATALRYAHSPDDAEDAYQRALEILLTKAPTTNEQELLAWLKTVVRHECFALNQKRARDVPAEHDALDAFAGGDPEYATERAERYARLRVGAEALGRLKPQETRALLLKAEGLSYQEIAAQTGWSYTKVNRCLTEGRRAFVARVERIESGAECERLAPLLSALADGEASADDMATLRPHLRGCATCRATLRDYREAPREVAGLAAPVAVGGLFAWLGERLAAAWGTLRALFEGAAAHKAAVVASTVAVAGGGAAAAERIAEAPSPAPAKHAAAAPKRAPAVAPPIAAPTATVRAAGSRASDGTRHKRLKPRAVADNDAGKDGIGQTAAAAPARDPNSAPVAPAEQEPRAQPAAEPAGEFGP